MQSIEIENVLCNEIETQYEKNNVLQLGLQLPF
jgi:hypothetical protein